MINMGLYFFIVFKRPSNTSTSIPSTSILIRLILVDGKFFFTQLSPLKTSEILFFVNFSLCFTIAVICPVFSKLKL